MPGKMAQPTSDLTCVKCIFAILAGPSALVPTNVFLLS